MKEPVLRGIDLSHWNNVLNWNHVCSAIDFCMLKVGGEEKKVHKINYDPCFEKYYTELRKRRIPVGAYFFMGGKYATISSTPTVVCYELDSYLKKFELEMPIVLDVEGKIEGTKAERTAYVEDWCDLMEDLGYYVMIYGSDMSTFNDIVDLKRLERFDKWVARYGKEPQNVKDYGMWQYSSDGFIPLAASYIDMDYAYKDYPSIIRNKNLNNL